MTRLLSTAVIAAALSAPALGASYPVSGAFGESAKTTPGPIDCRGLRIVTFFGNQRTDSNGGAPAFRNRSIQRAGEGRWRVVDEFITGQISDAYVAYTLRLIDEDHVELVMRQGGTLRLQRCR